MGIATILIALRLWVRARITRKVGWDDYLITIALVVTTIGLCFNCKVLEAGFGRHLYYLKKTAPKQIVRATRWHVLWQPTFFISVTLIRISICQLLLRIFGVNHRWRYGLWAAMVLITAIAIPSFVLIYIQCRPYEKIWNPLLPGTCLPSDTNVKMALYSGILAVIQDWALATLPTAFLWNMQIGLKQTIAICGLMSMGYFSGICAIVRTVISMQVFNAGGLADFSWVTIDLRIWGIVENLVDIIAASIPTLKPLYVKTLGSHYFSWSKKSFSKGYVAHSDDKPSRKPASDPYSTSLGSDGGGRSHSEARGHASYRSKRRDQINVQTVIELDEFDERKPMKFRGTRQDPTWHV